ncbi:MAG: hypothetical protein KDI66_23260 [Xanthomonadales bacterium]|nr:hypothetical protein [Xanthomonadales bacterium]
MSEANRICRDDQRVRWVLGRVNPHGFAVRIPPLTAIVERPGFVVSQGGDFMVGDVHPT